MDCRYSGYVVVPEGNATLPEALGHSDLVPNAQEYFGGLINIPFPALAWIKVASHAIAPQLEAAACERLANFPFLTSFESALCFRVKHDDPARLIMERVAQLQALRMQADQTRELVIFICDQSLGFERLAHDLCGGPGFSMDRACKDGEMASPDC